MADKSETAVIAIAIVALVAVAGVLFYHHFAVEDNTDGGDTSDTYWYYLNFGDNDARTGWYSGTGHDAAEGLSSATTAAGFDLEINSYGYVTSIDGASGDNGWSTICYLYSGYSQEAQAASILYPTTSSYGTFVHSNGWASFNGFDSSAVTGNKMSESCFDVFYLAMYAADYSVATPVSDSSWMNKGPFADGGSVADTETQIYWFYLNFGDNDTRTGWYSGTGTNVAEGLAAATTAAGFELEINRSGYVATIDGTGGSYGWSILNYLYSTYTQDAVNGSVAYPNDLYEVYFMYSNGWLAFNGYDWPEGESGNKMAQSASTVFYMGMYDDTTWAAPNPIDDNNWKTGGPFASA